MGDWAGTKKGKWLLCGAVFIACFLTIGWLGGSQALTAKMLKIAWSVTGAILFYGLKKMLVRSASPSLFFDSSEGLPGAIRFAGCQITSAIFIVGGAYIFTSAIPDG